MVFKLYGLNFFMQIQICLAHVCSSHFFRTALTDIFNLALVLIWCDIHKKNQTVAGI